MLQLKNIVKSYRTGDGSEVKALRGVSVSFRDHEFVSILGPSGCGKTTLLNIIGGLDRYTDGDLIIKGRSTKEFVDKDWDAYRNHSIGFVFQSYQLIPHQTVLANVELALTLSGVSKAERRKRAIQALEQVGLGDQLKKKPNQMSGGQMQRVAIARALVNDPEILLADEPTGALDSETSVQVMDLLKKISDDRLIIMVTHNKELAEQYSTRIVSLFDGKVTNDTDPYEEEAVKKAELTKAELAQKKKEEAQKTKRTSMSFGTALSLSFHNLMTKRARTLLTAFAGSIGIIGIALILALSTGVQAYIDQVQRDTLSSYPITILAEEADLSSLFAALGNRASSSDLVHENDAVYANARIYELFNSFFHVEKSQNDLVSFKKFLDKETNPETSTTGLHEYVSSVQYSYPVALNTYVLTEDGSYRDTDISSMFADYFEEQMGGSMMMGNSELMGSMSSGFSGIQLWQELLPGSDGAAVSDLLFEQYDLLYGRWPEKDDEIVLIVDKHNEISDLAFYALGQVESEEIQKIFMAALKQEDIKTEQRVLDYEKACGITFRLLTNSDYYHDPDGDGIFESILSDETLLNAKIKQGKELKITGVIRPNEDATATALSATFGYTSGLTEWMIQTTAESEVVKAQKKPENENFDVLTGRSFTPSEEEEKTDAQKAEAFLEYVASLTDEEKTELYRKIESLPSEEELKAAVDAMLTQYDTREKLEEAMASTYGMDEETIHSYFDGYSDEELNAFVREQIEAMVKTQYEAKAEETVNALKAAPSAEELAMLMAKINEALPDPMTKMGFVASDWAENTSMSMQSIFAYLSALPAEELENAVQTCAEKKARELYASMPADPNAGFAKVAAALDARLADTAEAELAAYADRYLPSTLSGSTLSSVLRKLGDADEASPSMIYIYAATFEDKDSISTLIADYNRSVDDEQKIAYTDYVALLMSGVTSIINAISYGLIVFVSISLVVSSIMIGIITYISVLERTREIGILRAIGASKKNISMVFNAETLIIGLAAGLIGIGLSLLLCIPISLIIHALSGINSINAFLYPSACVVLVLISMFLTFIAGLIPSGIASRKDPVEALRTE